MKELLMNLVEMLLLEYESLILTSISWYNFRSKSKNYIGFEESTKP
ncbi:MAG: hypothetical protein K0Q73_6477 [Paenibacillus sp.]|nr:hypothetical protein [Paenibacillus sp.]